MRLKALPLALAVITGVFSHRAHAQDKIVTYTLSINNVRAYTNTGGLLFNNFGLGAPGFEAPKQPLGTSAPRNSIYASTLWLGGLDAGGNLHIAAQTYRQMGNDFQPGPIDAATQNPVTDTLYNDMWRIKKSDAEAAKNGTLTPATAKWPVSYTAFGNTSPLAPYHDVNHNNKLDVDLGEYPEFPGDEALYFVYNDQMGHTETGGDALGVQVDGFMYAYATDSNEFLNNTIFVDYYIANKSSETYHDFIAAVWTDFDLGDYSDDRIGVDTIRNMYYAYNGNDTDLGGLGYGTRPPAIGVMFVNHPLYAAMGYTNDFSVIGNPLTDISYYSYSRAIWRDGSPLTYGGNGYNTGNRTRYALSGNPCNNTGWTEAGAGKPAGDRRMLGSVFFDSIKSGQVHKISVAYIWAQDQNGGATNSLCKLFAQTDSLQNWLAGQPPLSAPKPAPQKTIKIYPNPASSSVFIDTEETDLEVTVYDLAGRHVLASQTSTISVAGLAKGLYVVQVRAGQQYFTQKLQVQ